LINFLTKAFITARVVTYLYILLIINIILGLVGLVFGRPCPEQLGRKQIKSFLW